MHLLTVTTVQIKQRPPRDHHQTIIDYRCHVCSLVASRKLLLPLKRNRLKTDNSEGHNNQNNLSKNNVLSVFINLISLCQQLPEVSLVLEAHMEAAEKQWRAGQYVPYHIPDSPPGSINDDNDDTLTPSQDISFEDTLTDENIDKIPHVEDINDSGFENDKSLNYCTIKDKFNDELDPKDAEFSKNKELDNTESNEFEDEKSAVKDTTVYSFDETLDKFYGESEYTEFEMVPSKRTIVKTSDEGIYRTETTTKISYGVEEDGKDNRELHESEEFALESGTLNETERKRNNQSTLNVSFEGEEIFEDCVADAAIDRLDTLEETYSLEMKLALGVDSQ